MATQEHLDHDRMRVAVGRKVEEALGCGEDGVVGYFDQIPDDDEVADGNDDAFGNMCWKAAGDLNDDDTEDAVYRVAADAVFGLEAGTSVEEGYERVINTVRDVAFKFTAAVALLEEGRAGGAK